MGWKMLKKMKELFNRRNLVVYKLRKYLRKLYEGYPTHFFYGYEDIIEGIDKGIQHLIEDGIIKPSPQKIQTGFKEGETPVYKMRTLEPVFQSQYRLTSEGLKLVEDWNTKRLTWAGIIISFIILVLTIILTIMAITPAI